MASRLNVIREERLKKLRKLRELGISPFPSKIELKGAHIKILEARETEDEVLVAGRLMALRAHGAVSFADLRDETASIQLLFHKKIHLRQELRLSTPLIETHRLNIHRK